MRKKGNGWLMGGLAVAIAATEGCAYVEAKSDISSGRMAQREAAASHSVEVAQQRNQDLRRELALIEQDIQRNEKKLAALQGNLRKVALDLEAAQKARKISQAQYDKLKMELDAINRDAADQGFVLTGDRAVAWTNADERARQIATLQGRKANLEKVLADLVK